MSFLRKDGDFKVFVIKHKQSDGKWVYSSFDYFKYPADGVVRKHFGANGDCWQETGVFGCYNQQAALAGLAEIAQANPGVEFGLFSMELSQKTLAHPVAIRRDAMVTPA